MHLAIDYIHPYKSGVGYPSKCRIRLYLPDDLGERDAAVVICSELASNSGTSVNNAAEWIAGDVIHHHKLPVPLVWIEHYPPEATGGREEMFDLVVFSSYEVREVMIGGERCYEIGSPNWKHLDRVDVEILVGEKV